MDKMAFLIALPSRISNKVTARSAPVLASNEVSAGLNLTLVIESTPQEKVLMGEERE